MALFINSKADAKLSLLTQFYQLDVPDRSTFGSHETHMYGVVCSMLDEELRIWAEYQRERWQGEPLVRWPGTEAVGDLEQWGIFGGVHYFLTELMNCAADDLIPAPDTINTLDDWLAIVLPPPRVAWRSSFSSDTPPRVYLPALKAMEFLLHRPLAQEFLAALNGKKFKRCESCRNVFVEQKPGQRLCSQRCRTRVGNRRRYARLFEGMPTRRKGSLLEK